MTRDEYGKGNVPYTYVYIVTDNHLEHILEKICFM